MHSYQITESTLEDYRANKLLDDRITFLLQQADEQLAEIRQNSDFYTGILDELEIDDTLNNPIMWMLFMSDEDIVDAYIDTFKKPFRSIIPVADLADILLYLIHLKKVNGEALAGTDLLFESTTEGLDEVDHYCFSNVLAYVQRKNEGNCLTF